MRTPIGIECKYFYGNYYRGRHVEECRLIGKASPPNHWTADLCKSCPVPAILQANACPNLVLHAEVSRQFLGIKRKVKISSYCLKSQTNVAEPEIGCGQCHPEVNEIFENNEK
jgi:hypothetical protein